MKRSFDPIKRPDASKSEQHGLLDPAGPVASLQDGQGMQAAAPADGAVNVVLYTALCPFHGVPQGQDDFCVWHQGHYLRYQMGVWSI